MNRFYDKESHKKDEFKRVLSSIVFTAVCWIVFIVVFFGSLIFGILPLTPIYTSYLETVQIEDTTTGQTYTEDVYQGYYAVAWLGESNEYLTTGSLVYVRAYDPADNQLTVGVPALYYVETFNEETSVLESSELTLRIVTSFKVSDDYRYGYISSTDLNGEDAISDQRVRYDAMVGSLDAGQYTVIPVLGLWQGTVCSSVILSVIVSIVLAFLLLVLPILLVLKLRSHGYGMGNKAEQARVIRPVFGLVICIILLIALSFALFVPYYSTSLGFVVYEGESIETDDYSLTKNTLYSYSAFDLNDNALEAGDLFAFTKRTAARLYSESNTAELTFGVFSSGTMVFVYADDGVTITDAYMKVFYYEAGSTSISMMEIYVGDIIGAVVSPVPVYGSILCVFNSSPLASVATFFLLALLLLALPIYILIKRVRVSKRVSPFKDGLNVEVLSKESKFIYAQLKSFLKSGNLRIVKDYDCDKVYVNRKLFCKIVINKKIVTVLINKDFMRYDGRLDRSGFIAIPHVSDLDQAKSRIYQMYCQDFKKYKVKK